MHAIMSDADAMQYWSTLPHAELAETERWIARTIQSVASGESDDFAVLHDGALIGKAGLWKGNELGMLFDKRVWGTGLAAEAVNAVMDRARTRGLKIITADVDPRNTRAARFLKRLGFATAGSAKRTYTRSAMLGPTASIWN
jgi:ribosomal-protein-alanine N-acetyltransferase